MGLSMKARRLSAGSLPRMKTFPLLADVDDAAGAGETVEVLGIGELLCRGAGDDEIAREGFGFEAGAEVAEEGGTVFGQPAEEAVGRDAAGLAVGVAEVLACARHSVAFRLAGVEARQAVSEGADGLQFFGRTAEGARSTRTLHAS